MEEKIEERRKALEELRQIILDIDDLLKEAAVEKNVDNVVQFHRLLSDLSEKATKGELFEEWKYVIRDIKQEIRAKTNSEEAGFRIDQKIADLEYFERYIKELGY